MRKTNRSKVGRPRACLKCAIQVVALSIAMLLPAFGQTTQWSVQQLSNGNLVTFPTQFSDAPVTLTSAQVGGKAISSAAVSVTKSGFFISLYDDVGNAVNNAWVQWIAFIPDASKNCIGGIVQASNMQHISFPQLASGPVIVTNAQIGGIACISGAVNNASSGFDLYLVDDHGTGINNAWLLWMAVIPGQKNTFKGEVRQMNDGENIRFTPSFTAGAAYVLSAQPGIIAAAINNRLDGFSLSLVKHDGTAASGRWTQWIGYAGGQVGVVEGASLPVTFELHPAFPNPFNPTTCIEFSVPNGGHVTLKVHNALGEEVETLVSGHVSAGRRFVDWDASGQASGVYFCRLTAGGSVQVTKLVLVR